jgi:hypothetical protein
LCHQNDYINFSEKKLKSRKFKDFKLSLLLAVLVSLSWSKEKKEVEIPLNVGVGPAFFWIPDVVGRGVHTGAKLDLYAAITPQILKENENKIPKQYKKYVNMEKEMHLKPLWMMLIPEFLIVSPGEGSVYGGIWPVLSMSGDLIDSKHVGLFWELVLPTISYIYASASKNDPDGQHLWGIGTMLRIENTIKFTENFLASLSYGHNFNAPLQYLGFPSPNNGYKEEGKSAREQWIQTGILALVFHFRFNIKQKI